MISIQLTLKLISISQRQLLFYGNNQIDNKSNKYCNQVLLDQTILRFHLRKRL